MCCSRLFHTTGVGEFVYTQTECINDISIYTSAVSIIECHPGTFPDRFLSGWNLPMCSLLFVFWMSLFSVSPPTYARLTSSHFDDYYVSHYSLWFSMLVNCPFFKFVCGSNFTYTLVLVSHYEQLQKHLGKMIELPLRKHFIQLLSTNYKTGVWWEQENSFASLLHTFTINVLHHLVHGYSNWPNYHPFRRTKQLL